MPNKKYDHNVDIKSTQLGDAITKGVVTIGAGAIGIVGGGVIGLSVVVSIAIAIGEIQDRVKENKERSRTVSIAPVSKLRTILYDYQNNEARYQIDWENRYVTYTGKVAKINSGKFDISTQMPRLAKVVCDWKGDQKERVAKLNTGDTIYVSGKLNVSKTYSSKIYEFKISSCEIP